MTIFDSLRYHIPEYGLSAREFSSLPLDIQMEWQRQLLNSPSCASADIWKTVIDGTNEYIAKRDIDDYFSYN